MEFACTRTNESGRAWEGPGALCFPPALAHSSGCPAAGLWAFPLREGGKKNAVFKFGFIRESCKKQLLVLAKAPGAAPAASPWSSGAGGRCARPTAPGSVLLWCWSCRTGTGTATLQRSQSHPGCTNTGQHSRETRKVEGEALEAPLSLAQMFQQQNQLLFRAQVRAEHSQG